MSTVLGIHTNVTGGSSGETSMIDGHAWISVRRRGAVEYYGLWPDSHPGTTDNGAGSDIRVDKERFYQSADSRYYLLTSEQEKVLNRLLLIHVKWGYTHNCSSWSSELVRKVTRENIRADEPIIRFVETPRRLGLSIRRLEAKSPSSINDPIPIKPHVKPSSQTSSMRLVKN